MRKTTKAQNLTRLEETLSGDEIEALNNVSPGLGSKVHKLFAMLGNIQAAQAGYSGTVTIAAQKKKDTRGRPMPAISLQDQRLADTADPIDDLDAVNLRTLRSFVDCVKLTEILRDCPEAAESISENTETTIEITKTERDCLENSIDFTSGGSIDTGLTAIHSIRALNEYVYVAGLSGVTPTLQSYRMKRDGNFVLLDSVTLTQEIRRFVMHGSFLFGCRDGADAQTVISIDVGKPWSLAEKDQLDIGFAAQGLDAQGCFLYVVGGSSVAVVDITDPSIMRKVN